jgi:hypothetical protein
MPKEAMKGRICKLLAIAAYCCMAAAIVRWPSIPFWNAAPLEPNFPLHALASLGLYEGDFWRLSFLEWPNGASVRYIGWPAMSISAILNAVLPPIAAMNLAVWTWVALQGIGTWLLGRAWGWSGPGCFAAASAAIFAPQSLIALSNGQFENAALMPLIWTAWSSQKRRIGHFIPAFAVCLFSSPYQGVSAVIVALLASGWSRAVIMAGVPLLAMAGLYYGAVAADEVHAAVTPAAASMSEHASLSGLMLPFNIAEDGGLGLPNAWERIQALSNLPTADFYSHKWPWLVPTASSHLGVALLLFGGFGLWRKRRIWGRTIAWGCLCLLLALGPVFTLGSISIPLPWTLLEQLPGLGLMQATCRFLGGLTAALVIGVALLVRTRREAAAVSLLIAAEGLLVSPSHWPLRSMEPLRSEVLEQISREQAAAFWPAPPIVASNKVTMAALILEKPLALFSEKGMGMPEADGSLKRGPGTPVDKNGLELEEWADGIHSAGIRSLLQFRDTMGSQAQPVVAGYGECDEYFCVWTLPGD